MDRRDTRDTRDGSLFEDDKYSPAGPLSSRPTDDQIIRFFPDCMYRIFYWAHLIAVIIFGLGLGNSLLICSELPDRCGSCCFYDIITFGIVFFALTSFHVCLFAIPLVWKAGKILFSRYPLLRKSSYAGKRSQWLPLIRFLSPWFRLLLFGIAITLQHGRAVLAEGSVLAFCLLRILDGICWIVLVYLINVCALIESPTDAPYFTAQSLTRMKKLCNLALIHNFFLFAADAFQAGFRVIDKEIEDEIIRAELSAFTMEAFAAYFRLWLFLYFYEKRLYGDADILQGSHYIEAAVVTCKHAEEQPLHLLKKFLQGHPTFRTAFYQAWHLFTPNRSGLTPEEIAQREAWKHLLCECPVLIFTRKYFIQACLRHPDLKFIRSERNDAKSVKNLMSMISRTFDGPDDLPILSCLGLFFLTFIPNCVDPNYQHRVLSPTLLPPVVETKALSTEVSTPRSSRSGTRSQSEDKSTRGTSDSRSAHVWGEVTSPPAGGADSQNQDDAIIADSSDDELIRRPLLAQDSGEDDSLEKDSCYYLTKMILIMLAFCLVVEFLFIFWCIGYFIYTVLWMVLEQLSPKFPINDALIFSAAAAASSTGSCLLFLILCGLFWMRSKFKNSIAASESELEKHHCSINRVRYPFYWPTNLSKKRIWILCCLGAAAVGNIILYRLEQHEWLGPTVVVDSCLCLYTLWTVQPLPLRLRNSQSFVTTEKEEGLFGVFLLLSVLHNFSMFGLKTMALAFHTFNKDLAGIEIFFETMSFIFAVYLRYFLCTGFIEKLMNPNRDVRGKKWYGKLGISPRENN